MDSLKHITERLNQDKKNSYAKEVERCTDDLKRTREELENALRDNMKTLTSPPLSTEEIDTRLKKIMGIIAAPVSALPEIIAVNTDDLRKRLARVVELHDQLQPSCTSKLAAIGFASPRETIKSHLNTVGIRETIDPCMNAFLLAQSQLLAQHIAYYHALEQADWIDKAQKTYPSSSVEILLLHRHEVCSSLLNKGLGFIEDAGLDAITLGASQSKFALSRAQLVKQTMLMHLTILHSIKTIEMKVSPVTRAYQTALSGSFSPALINKVTVDPHYAEVQLNTTLIASGRALRSCKSIAGDFTTEGYEADYDDDFIINGEDNVSFLKRLNIAYKRMINREVNPLTMQIIMGHGTMNTHLLRHLYYHTASNNIPFQPPTLEPGGYYYLLLIRKEGNLVAVDYKGDFDRYGQQKNTIPSPIKMLSDSDYFKRLDLDDIPQAATRELKASLLFHRCLMDTNEERVKAILSKPDYVDIMLDHLVLLNYDNLEKTFLILKTLTETQSQRIEVRMKEERTYAIGSFFASLRNTASGKHPETQHLILKELSDIIGKAKNENVLSTLEAIVQKSEKTCFEGKVTNLCRALCVWEERHQKSKPVEIIVTDDDSNTTDEEEAEYVYKG